MKTLLIIVCCILLVNWGLDGHSFHTMNIHWGYDFPYSISTIVSSGISFVVGLVVAFTHLLGFALVLGLLIYICLTFGAVGFVVSILFLAFASMLVSLVSLFWPVLIIGTVILLCSSKKRRYRY